MAKNAELSRVRRKAAHDQLSQFVAHILVHAKVSRPRLFRCSQIEARPAAELPVSGLTGDASVARTGVAGHQHQPVLRGEALRATFRGEALLIAREACQIEECRHRATLRLRWSI